MIDHPFLSILLGIAILYIAGLLSNKFFDKNNEGFWDTVVNGFGFLGALFCLVGMIMAILMVFGLEL